MTRYLLPIAFLILGVCIGATVRDTAIAQEKSDKLPAAKWEYAVEWMAWEGGSRKDAEKRLNQRAADGWEYVNAPGEGAVVFRRLVAAKRE